MIPALYQFLRWTQAFVFIHGGLVTPYGIGYLGKHLFRWCRLLGVKYYLNQCKRNVKWALRNKVQWDLISTEISFAIALCKYQYVSICKLAIGDVLQISEPQWCVTTLGERPKWVFLRLLNRRWRGHGDQFSLISALWNDAFASPMQSRHLFSDTN